MVKPKSGALMQIYLRIYQIYNTMLFKYYTVNYLMLILMDIKAYLHN